MKSVIKYMTDEQTNKFRQLLIQEGVIKPADKEYHYYERPLMSEEAVERTRLHYLKHTLIVPKEMRKLNGKRH